MRPTSLKRVLFFIIADILLSLFTLYFSYELRFNFDIPSKFLASFWLVFLTIISLKIAFLYISKLYFAVWRFFGFYEAKSIVKVHVYAYTIFLIIFLVFGKIYAPFPRSVMIIDFFLSMIFLGTLRASKRLVMESAGVQHIKGTLIIGTNSKTSTIIQSALKGEIDYYPEAIISLTPDEMNKNAYINNIKIYDLEQMNDLVVEKNITSAIIVESLSSKELHIIADKLNSIGIFEIKQMKILGSQQEKLEDLSIEDLLARHPKDLDTDLIASFIKDKSVLITGAGGSIGSEIARQCSRLGASDLTLVDSGEFNLYQIGEQIDNAQLKLISVTDNYRLKKLFANVRPDIVIHAAAYKHVPICEANPDMAVFNNVLGSKNVIDISIEYAVQKVVIISTDKAVRPTNIMGATKRVTELYANNVDAKDTEIVAVRFGNVLGSSGSVIPKFKRQIGDGGPVTVTHPDITRYFMLIPEACQLVLQTASIAKGGELFILDMGNPIKIADLAHQMIRLYGKEGEVDVIYSGLRPGEKLYEELLIDDSERKTRYSSIFIAKPTKYEIAKLEKDILNLLASEDKVSALQKIVPEFVQNHK